MPTLGEKVLWRRAQDWLEKYKPELIGVAGTYQKNLTKEALRLAVGDAKALRVSPHTPHHPVGVALSVLGLPADYASTQPWWRLLARSLMRELDSSEPEVLALSLPTHKPGDIKSITKDINFSIGIITNVGTKHTELFENKKNKAHELEALIASLPTNGTAILNVDDPLVQEIEKRTRCNVITIGESPGTDVELKRVHRLNPTGLACEIVVRNKPYEVRFSNLLVREQLIAALAALATSLALDVDMKTAVKNIATLAPPEHNKQPRLIKISNSITIIDDHRDAGLEDMLAMLHFLHTYSATIRTRASHRDTIPPRSIAVLAGIPNLGTLSQDAHEQIGIAAAHDADILVGVGESMRIAQNIALKQGDYKTDVHHFNTSNDAGSWLKTIMQPGDIILIKGGDGMGMGKLVDYLVKEG